MIITSAPLSKFYVCEQIKTIFVCTSDDIDEGILIVREVDEYTAKIAVSLGTYNLSFITGSALNLSESE